MVRIVLAVFALLTTPLAGCRPSPGGFQNGEPVLEIRAKPHAEFLERPATLESSASRVIRAPRFWGDRVLTWIAPEGSFVKKGEVVAVFDPAPVQNLLDSRNRAFQDATNSSETLRIDWAMRLDSESIRREQLGQNLVAAELQNEAARFLPEIPRSVALIRLDLAKGALQGAEQKQSLLGDFSKRRIEQATDREKEASHQISNVERLLRESQIRAPEDGIVLHLQITQGGDPARKVETGDNLERLQPFLQIHRAGGNILRIPVTERDLAKIRPGQKVDFRLRIEPGSVFRAQITDIPAMAASGHGGSKVFPVEAAIPDQPGADRLRPGMTADATIPVANHAECFAIPLDYVFQDPDGRNTVRLLAENGIWQEITLPPDLPKSGEHILLPRDFPGTRSNGSALLGIPPTKLKE